MSSLPAPVNRDRRGWFRVSDISVLFGLMILYAIPPFFRQAFFQQLIVVILVAGSALSFDRLKCRNG